MKDKICQNCEEVMSFKEYKEHHLMNVERAWTIKKYCDRYCKDQASLKRRKLRRGWKGDRRLR